MSIGQVVQHVQGCEISRSHVCVVGVKGGGEIAEKHVCLRCNIGLKLSVSLTTVIS